MDPFATATELAGFMGLPDPADLTRYQQHIAAASAMIRRFCGQDLSLVTGDVVVLEAVDRDTLILPERPVVAISSLLVSGVAYTNYRLNAKAGLIHNGSTSTTSEGTWWSAGATVTYDHGYVETDEEYQAIKAICLGIASRTLQRDERVNSEPAGFTLMETAGYAPEVFLTPGEKAQLADFGKVPVG